MYSFIYTNKNTRALFFACIGLTAAAISIMVITLSDACGPGRTKHRLQYISEDILTCKHSNNGLSQAVPWIVVVGYALLLPTIWYTWLRISMETEFIRRDGSVNEVVGNDQTESGWSSRNEIARFSFALLLTASLAGLIMGIHFELRGGWPNGTETTIPHQVGLIVWAGSFFIVHAMTLIAYGRLNTHQSLWYKTFEILYGILLISFAITFALDEQSAPFLQLVLLDSIFFVSVGNIALGYRLEFQDNPSFGLLMPDTPHV